MRLRPGYIFLTLCVIFIMFSFTIYLKPSYANSKAIEPEIKQAAAGRLVWQKYNCQGCHQLYGLGGYLGPDLTNVYSATGKGEPFIKAMIKVGTPQMPVFHLTEMEEAQLAAFLKMTDASGIADPRNFVTNSDGMITAK